MGVKRDLKDMRFGKLLVIQELPREERPNKKKVYWKCVCDCGKFSIAQTDNLVSGHTTSCGCKRAEVMSQTMKKNLVGQKFNKLLVLEETLERASDGCIMWKCKCDCGNITYVNSNSLKIGNIISCGCVRSKGEKRINSLLFDNNVRYKTQFYFSDLKDKSYLYFDFAIFDELDNLLCLVEYQGIQHFDPGAVHGAWDNLPQAHDQMKREYCKNHNIRLVEIPYTDYDKLDWKYLENKLNL